jgi:tetratricopeptide (TPR) repeat protein
VKIPNWDKLEADILRAVSNWLCDEANGHWVMIVDNADDPSVFFSQGDGSASKDGSSSVPQANSISDFLPQSPNGSILITSRNRELAYKLTESTSDIINVNPMDHGHALALLEKKLGTNLEGTDATELLQTLDYMPLAITQAAAYINQGAPRITVSRYLQDLLKGDRERENLLKKDVGDSRRDGKASNSIIATWQISFEHIRQHKPSAARLLSLMSLFNRQGIPELLLNHRYQEGHVEDDFEDDIQTLCNYSLIGTNADGNVFEMHRLVQFTTKAWLEINNELEKWKEQYIEVMDEVFPVGEYENWKTCLELFPHAENVLVYRPTNEAHLEKWSSILFNAAWYAGERGNYGTAEEMDRQALEGYKKALGPEHPDTLSSMANLAATYRNQGRWKEAEELFVQVMETSLRVLGEEHPDTLSSIANLASTYRNQGRWKKAEELDVQVMETRKRVLGEEHPDTLSSMANLAATYINQGRWKEAEELFVQVMETRKRVLGEEHPDTLSSIANLAATFWNQGRWKEAEELEVQVMETSSRVLGEEHPHTLSSIANLASTFWNQGRWKEAEELDVQVMETSLRVLGEEHPDTLNSIANLASTYRNQGRWKKAEELDVQVIETRKRVLGEEHPDTLSSIANLASTFWNQGRWKEAEELEVQVMETRKRVLGEEHPDTLSSMANLAQTWGSQCRNEEAILLIKKCFELQKQILGPHHPDTESSLETLNSWQMENLEI